MPRPKYLPCPCNADYDCSVHVVDLFFTLDDLHRFYLAAHKAGEADFPDHKPMSKRQFRNAIGPAAKHLFNPNRNSLSLTSQSTISYCKISKLYSELHELLHRLSVTGSVTLSVTLASQPPTRLVTLSPESVTLL
jgi:hypothetical protein